MRARQHVHANFADDRDVAQPTVIDEITGAIGVDGPSARAAQ